MTPTKPIRSVYGWIDEDFFDQNLCPGEGFWRLHGEPRTYWQRRKFVEVRITPIKKARKP